MRAPRVVREEPRTGPAAPLTSVALHDEIECAVFVGRRWRVIHEWNIDGRRMVSLRSDNWLIQRDEMALFFWERRMEEGLNERANDEADAARIDADHPTWPSPPPDMCADDAPTATKEP